MRTLTEGLLVVQVLLGLALGLTFLFAVFRDFHR
jgi:hypothetical protein